MSVVVKAVLESLKQAVEVREQTDPNHAIQTFSFSLVEPEQVEAGPEIHEQFESWLKTRFPKRTIRSDGYKKDGYNILVNVHN